MASAQRAQTWHRTPQQQTTLLAFRRKGITPEKGKRVPKAYQRGTFKEKADPIGEHVRKLLNERLRSKHRPLDNHLNDRHTLVFGVGNCRRPKPAMDWTVEMMEGKNGTYSSEKEQHFPPSRPWKVRGVRAPKDPDAFVVWPWTRKNNYADAVESGNRGGGLEPPGTGRPREGEAAGGSSPTHGARRD